MLTPARVVPISGIGIGSKGVVVGICDDIVEVIFIGGLLRFVYPNKIKLKQGNTNK